MFADALTGGDIKKLNEGMKEGKFKSFDLLKVATHMKDLVDPKLLAEMLKTAEKQVTRLSNSWLEFMTALNDSGLWDAIGKGVDGLTAGIKALTPEVKRIYPVFENFFKFLWENAGTLTAVWIAFKGFGATMAVFSTAAAAGQVMTLTTAFKALTLAMLRTVVIPAAIVTAILLAVDTIQAFQEKKKGVLWDFRPNTEEKRKEANEWATNVAARSDDVQANPDSLSPVGKFQLAGAIQKYASISDNQTAEEKHAVVARLRQRINPNVLGDDEIAPYLQQLDSEYRIKEGYAARSADFQARGGLKSSAIINVTIQNTEPNVSKDWLISTLPSVFGEAMNQHVQKEWSMVPNQSGGTS